LSEDVAPLLLRVVGERGPIRSWMVWRTVDFALSGKVLDVQFTSR